jgi:hypothetical protein
MDCLARVELHGTPSDEDQGQLSTSLANPRFYKIVVGGMGSDALRPAAATWKRNNVHVVGYEQRRLGFAE